MLNRLILKVTKFQLPPPNRLDTVGKNILGGHHAPPPMSNRVKSMAANNFCDETKSVLRGVGATVIVGPWCFLENKLFPPL